MSGEQIPTVGRIVHYSPTDLERATIQAANGNGSSLPLPAIIVRVWGNTPTSAVNLWVTSAVQGDGPRRWQWPPRA